MKTKAEKLEQEKREKNRLRQQKFLEQHRDEVNAKRRKEYKLRKKAGLCPRCKRKVPKGRILCKKCCSYAVSLNSQ
jgi:hypothetical protein